MKTPVEIEGHCDCQKGLESPKDREGMSHRWTDGKVSARPATPHGETAAKGQNTKCTDRNETQ